uniref:Uncharacterized protein n=1 Tax=Brassica oleracea var. oleracea TaxID=109376 RepID=A0A0D3CM39_BRAOL
MIPNLQNPFDHQPPNVALFMIFLHFIRLLQRTTPLLVCTNSFLARANASTFSLAHKHLHLA